VAQPETAIIKKIMSGLQQEYGDRWCGYKVHGDRYTVNQPDIVGCLDGRALVIEAKQPGEHARPGQLAILRRWRRSGALVVVDASSWEDVQRAIRKDGVNTG